MLSFGENLSVSELVAKQIVKLCKDHGAATSDRPDTFRASYLDGPDFSFPASKLLIRYLPTTKTSNWPDSAVDRNS